MALAQWSGAWSVELRDAVRDDENPERLDLPATRAQSSRRASTLLASTGIIGSWRNSS